MPDSENANETPSFSFARILLLLVPLAVIVFIGSKMLGSNAVDEAQRQIEANMLARLLGPVAEGPATGIDFTDADGDLLADPPPADQQAAPESLVFSYIANPEEGDEPAAWKDLVDALSQSLGMPVEFRHYTTNAAQLEALASGELHVTGFNTGAVPVAVRACGFVPVCTFGREDGGFGYTMQLITPKESDVDSPQKILGNKLLFVRPDSNSGCKAALVLLMDKYNLLPERDYQWAFTMGHDESIRTVALSDKNITAAVASDILIRMKEAGEVDGDAVRMVEESERFPPAALGYAHNLSEGLRTKIAETLLGFDWAGTSVEARYGAGGVTQFVAVNYKDDWANIRRIDEAVRKAREGATATAE